MLYIIEIVSDCTVIYVSLIIENTMWMAHLKAAC